MSQEQEADTQPEQQVKSASNKRNGRKRPVLVTSQTANFEELEANSAPATTIPTITEEAPVAKSRPGFFSTIGIGKREETADATAARLARATRKGVAPGKIETKGVAETKKPAPQAAKSVVKSAPARRGGFKPRHLIGILLYLIVADVVGVYEKSWLGKSDKLIFSLGPLPIYISTLLFLLTLVVLLVVLARFDLVPRSLTPAARQPVSANKGQSQNNSNEDSGNARNAPSIKQGIKGANDDLYQEYRESERYWKRRDRKK